MFQSTELTGGVGFTFEDAAVAVYLAALLGEETAPGLPGRVVVRVASQQAAFGHPLDDLVVEGRSSDDVPARLSLQVKRSIVVSAAASNADFREVVSRACETVKDDGFRERVDRVGLVTGTMADDAKRALETVCEWARDTATPEAFAARFGEGGPSGRQHRSGLAAVREILGGGPADPAAVDADAHKLLAHFVLLRFDLLHEGAAGETDAVARLRPHLAAEHADRADEVWRRLRLIAREAAGRAADYDRPTLLGRLLGAVRLAGAPSLRRDLDRLAEEARLSLADIPADIDGHVVARPALLAQAKAGLLDRPFLQLVGLPGSGKSAVLRELAEARLRSGPALVLKADRLSGPNWAAYARTIGLTATGLEALLTEIAAAGSPVLFVDGIDRIGVEHRGILLDLLHTILGSPTLRAVWRIAATVRDNGVEPLRTWLPAELLGDGGVATLTVQPFDDGEALALASARPALAPLLFGDERVREVARRPFFAAVLVRSLPRSAGEGRATPRSETELVEVWWSGGGYLAAPASVGRRQRTLVALAKAGAARPGRALSTGLDGVDPDAVDELRRDGVLRDARPGHSVRFAHDIFFEWAVLHLLISREDAWLDEVRAAGEPPVLGRAVELLSQEAFSSGEGWAEQLRGVEQSALRPQWARAWLLGPLSAADFADRAAPFADAVFGDGARWFARLVVWFQAEKTRPNPLVLRGVVGKAGWSEREVAQAADALAVPSDYRTWARCCAWIMDHAGRCPVRIIPDIVSVFEVWQNALADIPNAVSGRILPLVQDWLEDIEDKRRPEKGFRLDRGRWGELEDGGIEELEGRLRSLLLRAARSTAPERIGAYLARVRARSRLRRAVFEQVLQFAPILSEAHAAELVELTTSELLEELPADVAARPPEPGLFSRSFSHHDWGQLAISYTGHGFFPASPLREPFHSLFARSPAEGLRLVRHLSNHAITAWRHLFDLDWERRATPIPLALDFPWGRQVFWGDGRVYQWFRGNWAPHPVGSGLMALEHWAFAELECGRDADEVIREVVAGHESVAVLGIALALALTARRASAATLPLAVDQRLWHWDLSRGVNDASSPANTIGFMKPTDRGHAEAVRDGNAREARRMEVRHLAQLFVLGADDALREAAGRAIETFPQELPFDFEEEREAETRAASLRRTAEIWAEFGRQENYVAITAEDGKGYRVLLDNPRSADPDVVEATERHATMVEHLTLLGWARDCFEQGRLSDKLDLADALERARRLADRDLFVGTLDDDDPLDQKGSAVAGAAAAALRFAAGLRQPDLAWAGDVTLRAVEAPENRGPLWSSGSLLPYHPRLAAADGLAALVRRGTRTDEAGRALLRLAGHPHEQISAAAIGAALGCWDHDRGLAWAGLRLGLRLSFGEKRGARTSAFGYDHESHPERVARAVGEALRELDRACGATCSSLPDLPDPWVFAPPSPRDDDLPFGPTHQPGPVWRDPDVFLRWDFLPKVLGEVPIGRVMDDPARRPALLALCDQLVAWTVERLEPSWLQKSDRERRDRHRTDLYEWRSRLYAFLAQVALHLEAGEARRRFLEPAFALDDKLAASLVRPFADRLVCTLMDAPSIDARALTLLEDCVSRVLRHEAWDRARRRGGELYGFDLPELVRTLFFVQVEHAGGAARFANGDWREVRQVFPVIDPLVRAVGDVPGVTLSYLTLCERAVDHYPAADFVGQIAAILDRQPGIPAGWRGSTIPGRIAALVQALVERAQPLPSPLHRSMLLVLDRLVEMGDRRSAALQASEIFRNVVLH